MPLFILVIITPLLYLVAILSVVFTARLSGYENLLRVMTQENGFFEILSVVLLFGIFFYGIASSIVNRKTLGRRILIIVLFFSLFALFAAMEEISWGQHLFHFQSSNYFLKENYQKETNFHNLINGKIFNVVIYTTIYALLVFIPLLTKIFHKNLMRFRLFSYFDFNPHIILIALFSSVFQLFFHDQIGILIDMLTHITALLLFWYFIIANKSTGWVKLHFLFVFLATVFSVYHSGVYSFFNMQYEIRESFVVLAVLLIFMEIVNKEKAFISS